MLSDEWIGKEVTAPRARAAASVLLGTDTVVFLRHDGAGSSTAGRWPSVPAGRWPSVPAWQMAVSAGSALPCRLRTDCCTGVLPASLPYRLLRCCTDRCTDLEHRLVGMQSTGADPAGQHQDRRLHLQVADAGVSDRARSDRCGRPRPQRLPLCTDMCMIIPASISALSRHRRRHVHYTGMGMQVLKMTASERRSF